MFKLIKKVYLNCQEYDLDTMMDIIDWLPDNVKVEKCSFVRSSTEGPYQDLYEKSFLHIYSEDFEAYGGSDVVLLKEVFFDKEKQEVDLSKVWSKEYNENNKTNISPIYTFPESGCYSISYSGPNPEYVIPSITGNVVDNTSSITSEKIFACAKEELNKGYISPIQFNTVANYQELRAKVLNNVASPENDKLQDKLDSFSKEFDKCMEDIVRNQALMGQTFIYVDSKGITPQIDIGEFYMNDVGEWLNIKKIPNCSHEFKHYVGLTQEYEYCVKCDEKKHD